MSVHEYIRTCAISRRHRAALENDSIAPIILNAYRKLMKEQTKICEHCARWRSKEHTFCEAHRYRSMVTGQLNWKDAADEDDIEWFHALEPSPESTQESHGKWRKKRF
ncbi:MAG: hypothetical protein Hyperionvirus6_5 [Hyperionvirus sp.]|uniref:Uncharacterized protein n=1 Tax=Hyperionvirus sp. TaxID=2487770 RepID=A0A3G5AA08_9VIRU|nr:MAG: hypothetical protein Hyperionvirus6_5 [Hyperionvirus sp.]